MSNNTEKLAKIRKLLDVALENDSITVEDIAERISNVLNEAEVSKILVLSSGFGTITVNGVQCAVIPVERLATVHHGSAAECVGAALRAQKTLDEND